MTNVTSSVLAVPGEGASFNAPRLVAVVLFSSCVPPYTRGFLTNPTREKSFPTTPTRLTFVNKDAVNTLKLGQARGICMLVPALAGLEVEEYAPNAIKKAVVGVGHATKDQIEYMIKLQFPNIKLNGADATDALAVAICHASHMRYSMQLQSKLISVSEENDW